jgi:surface antigen/LysM repeat protein
MKFTRPKMALSKARIKRMDPTRAVQNALAATPFDPKKIGKDARRRIVRRGIIGGNLLLLLLIGLFILTNRSASQTILSGTIDNAVTTTSSLSNPLDQLSSDQIALQAAQMTNLPELTMVRNRADSAVALLGVVPNDSTTLAKPQIVTTAEKSRYDITSYVVQTGDTVESVAAKFNLNPNSIRWSNNITNDSLKTGTTLQIPPEDGIVYTVKQGDTVSSITSKYQANQGTFVEVNDAESGVSAGEVVWIPNGLQPVAAPVFNQLSFGAISGGFFYSGACINNGYDCGWCTWWAAFRRAQIGRPVPPNLGDAYSWVYLAPSAGLAVGLTPQPGAVIWFPGADHVGFVESVGADGSAYISEMHVDGYNEVTYRTIPAADVGEYKYIY